MTVDTHHRGLGNTLTPLKRQLVQKNDSGVYAAVNLTGKTVYFRMEDEDGNDVIAGTSAACTVTDAANGKVEYDFQSADVDEAGTYYGYFDVYSGGEFDTFPAEAKSLKIIVN